MAKRTHAKVLKAVRELGASADREAIAGAFVASLGERPGFWRAPLGALAVAERVPAHRYRAFSGSSGACRVCGLEPNNDDDELHERGQRIPGDLGTAQLALERAALEDAPRPSREAVGRLQRLLAIVGELPPTAREGKLNAAIKGEKLVLGNKYDLRSVIETLGACGILETPEYPGFTTAWTTFAARQDKPGDRVEVDPPIAFWTASHGVNAANVAAWFGFLKVRVPKKAGPRKAGVSKASASAKKRAKRAARSTELEVGDAIAFLVEESWRAAVVVDHHKDKGGRYPILEVVEWSGEEAPTLRDLRGARAAGEHGRANRTMIDLWKRDDPKGRWQYLGTGLPAPSTKHLGPSLGLYGVATLRRDGLARL